MNLNILLLNIKFVYSSIIRNKTVMTVQELIEILEKVENKDLDVIVQSTDPTDWTYNNDVEYVGVGSVYLNDDDDDETEVFIIDGGSV